MSEENSQQLGDEDPDEAELDEVDERIRVFLRLLSSKDRRHKHKDLC